MKIEGLFHYLDVCNGKTLPLYMKTKHIPVSYRPNDSLDTLWDIHNEHLLNAKYETEFPDQSLLDLKIDIASKLYSDCIFCEHRCNVDRNDKTGVCGVNETLVASDFIHHGEESFFTPSRTIFFSGCTFQCVFCQNYEISQNQTGLYLKPNQLAERIKIGIANGSRNVNWVGGEPTPHLLYILQTINQLDVSLPQIWNSNMYCSQETMQLLNGIVDVYLSDFKFGNDECGKKLANITEYTKVVKRNHLLAKKQADVLIGHLLMPHHINCCSKPILSWIATSMPYTPVNLMNQYHPAYKATSIPLLKATCFTADYEQVKSFAQKQGVLLITE
ncbi:MAG: radical SAM protein [Candidatus Thermoplasmatota archaeon]|nr:radical SAM protein [Candidatus Thermoplasmatota archaeon]